MRRPTAESKPWRPGFRRPLPQNGFRIVACEQCNRPINHTNLTDIKVFCDDTCLQSYVSEHCPDGAMDDLLKSIDYEQQRQEYLEEEF